MPSFAVPPASTVTSGSASVVTESARTTSPIKVFRDQTNRMERPWATSRSADFAKLRSGAQAAPSLKLQRAELDEPFETKLKRPLFPPRASAPVAMPKPVTTVGVPPASKATLLSMTEVAPEGSERKWAAAEGDEDDWQAVGAGLWVSPTEAPRSLPRAASPPPLSASPAASGPAAKRALLITAVSAWRGATRSFRPRQSRGALLARAR